MKEEYEIIFITEEGRAIKNNKTGKIYHSEFEIIDEKNKQIDRLNNIINQADNKNLELIQKINKIYDVIENKNITGIEARLLIQDILDKEE